VVQVEVTRVGRGQRSGSAGSEYVLEDGPTERSPTVTEHTHVRCLLES
jgi:hypothetical protein